MLLVEHHAQRRGRRTREGRGRWEESERLAAEQKRATAMDQGPQLNPNDWNEK